MSPKLSPVKSKRLARVLEKRGWQLSRTTGSHYIYEHLESRRTVSVPMHNRDMRIGTLDRILKDAGISRDEFQKLL